MNVRRPTPELIAARRWEIKQRYERHTKVGKRTKSMAAIRLAELTRWLEDTHRIVLEPSDQSETIARIFVHHFIGLSQGKRRASEWLNRHCPTMSLRDRERMISDASHCPLKWSADKLGWKIGLTDEQRARLKIKTIGARGINKEQRAQRRKEQRAALMRALRARRKANRVNNI